MSAPIATPAAPRPTTSAQAEYLHPRHTRGELLNRERREGAAAFDAMCAARPLAPPSRALSPERPRSAAALGIARDVASKAYDARTGVEWGCSGARDMAASSRAVGGMLSRVLR